MKNLIKKMQNWSLSKLIINTIVFYVFASFSILWIIVDFVLLSNFGKNLSIVSYVAFAVCLTLSVMYGKKIIVHLVKIKRGEVLKDEN